MQLFECFLTYSMIFTYLKMICIAFEILLLSTAECTDKNVCYKLVYSL